MKTLNRPTASFTPTSSLADLNQRVRKLWAEPPTLTGDERDMLVTSLIDVDIALERLEIRARCSLSDSSEPSIDDLDEFGRCRDTLTYLERAWHRSPAARPPPD